MPAAQGVHDNARLVSEKEFMAHGKQVVARPLPTGAPLPFNAAYLPATHISHTADPIVPVTEPAEQVVH